MKFLKYYNDRYINADKIIKIYISPDDLEEYNNNAGKHFDVVLTCYEIVCQTVGGREEVIESNITKKEDANGKLEEIIFQLTREAKNG